MDADWDGVWVTGHGGLCAPCSLQQAISDQFQYSLGYTDISVGFNILLNQDSMNPLWIIPVSSKRLQVSESYGQHFKFIHILLSQQI